MRALIASIVAGLYGIDVMSGCGGTYPVLDPPLFFKVMSFALWFVPAWFIFDDFFRDRPEPEDPTAEKTAAKKRKEEEARLKT